MIYFLIIYWLVLRYNAQQNWKEATQCYADLIGNVYEKKEIQMQNSYFVRNNKSYYVEIRKKLA